MRFYLSILVAVSVLLPLSPSWAFPECEGSPVKEGDRKNFWTNCVGTYTYANGDKYVGEHKDNKKHGQGTFTWTNGEKYVGEWKDGKKHGQGTFNYLNGQQYVGEWKNGVFHGQGAFSWASGRVWDGQWKDGKWDNGRKYTKGEYKLFLIVLLISAVALWICRN